MNYLTVDPLGIFIVLCFFLLSIAFMAVRIVDTCRSISRCKSMVKLGISLFLLCLIVL